MPSIDEYMRRLAVLIRTTSVCAALAVAVLAIRPASGAQDDITFEGRDALAGWTIAGDVSVDTARKHQGAGGR